MSPAPRLGSGAGRVGRRAVLVTLTTAFGAAALGRIPYGGRVRLKVPWGLASVDPHALDDPAAALFADAIADPLYALDASGQPYPTLAAELPSRVSRGALVRLRPYLNTAHGLALDARDLLFSIARSRARAGVCVLSPFADPVPARDDGLAVVFPGADPDALALALSSPVTALLPRKFSPARPDGTGSFAAEVGSGRLTLTRNTRAARGAAYLSRIEVSRARDMADALRSFEVGDVDVGWLGPGLHRPRPGAWSFLAGRLGWVILRTGAQAREWGAPGVAQRLLDGIGAARLKHLGLHRVPPARGTSAWGGPPGEILVADDAAHLTEIARTLAGHLSQPGHEVRAAPRSPRVVREAAQNGRFLLLLDFVRPLGPTNEHMLLALLAAADPRLAQRPPKLETGDPRLVAQTLPFGVVGELYIEGAHVPQLHGVDGWVLGALWFG